MAFTLAQFCNTRPYLYHLTALANLGTILADRSLYSAEYLCERAGVTLNGKRREHFPLDLDGTPILLRDQRPLHPGNVALGDGWTWDDLLRELNQRVFFWPGRIDGPSDHGRRHHQRYADERPLLLRLMTRDVISANPGRPPEFCRYNSGAPRCTKGRGSPRGADSFVPADRFPGRASQVVEVTYVRRVLLPQRVELSHDGGRNWRDV